MRADRPCHALLTLALLSCVAAQNTTNDTSAYPFDPILRYRPGFARSLPVQILLAGIVFTLTAALIIHILFTAQYHWPISPLNFVLQLCAASTLLVSYAATIQVILSTVAGQSRQWPYMLNYIAVDFPPLDPEIQNNSWTTTGLAAWLLMNATVGMLIQITHIQFLTLLYPSTLERRLIYALLGPLAVVSAAMHIVRIHTDSKMSDVAFAIQNVCNATLSLLFTASLFLWGFLVNRKQAWRTDGGTANFGAGATTLAIASTTFTFLYIPSEEQYEWLHGLTWATILWQSFLGWWWWVGAGMGVGEVEELLRREEKRRRKRSVQLARRKVRRERAQTLWRSVWDALGYPRRSAPPQSDADGEEPAPAESAPDAGCAASPPAVSRTSTGADTGSTSGAASASAAGSARTGTARVLDARAWHTLHGWFLHLRHAHLAAARAQAVERVERIQQAYGPDGQPGAGGVWGPGSFGLGAGPAREEGVEMRTFWRDRDGDAHASAVGEAEGVLHMRRRAGEGVEGEDARPPRSAWWWGFLSEWRLQDTTVY
ncbi:hypothetical protein OBBRIDRAFT_807896 [Obba rivulosa]|uniref:Uncharacterized protein n=1 Tax=Obba rivulosa TaxID=1052685 RepID=A0A8E2AIS6_9APHY|nr:hypothetical protein OBBRIDRAFT_807896 [Obba rivulosa]